LREDVLQPGLCSGAAISPRLSKPPRSSLITLNCPILDDPKLPTSLETKSAESWTWHCVLIWHYRLSSPVYPSMSSASWRGWGQAGSATGSASGRGWLHWGFRWGSEDSCSLQDWPTALHLTPGPHRRCYLLIQRVPPQELVDALIPLQNVAAFVCITRVQIGAGKFSYHSLYSCIC